jgi:uridine kinase
VVGIDGPDCSGKSTLSRRVIQAVKGHLAAACLHCDDYANDRETRQRRGAFSADAFYFDYFDAEAIQNSIIAIVSSGGGVLPLLLVEGLFLYRPPLRPLFDYRIRIDISEAMVLARALERDVGRIGDEDWVRRHYQEQCFPAQRRYMREHKPAAGVDLLLTARQDGSFHVCC